MGKGAGDGGGEIGGGGGARNHTKLEISSCHSMQRKTNNNTDNMLNRMCTIVIAATG